jgi:ketosteroid isomerase-like protein
MAHPDEDVVRAGFAAFGQGAADALRQQCFAADIRWHFPAAVFSPVATKGWTGSSSSPAGSPGFRAARTALSCTT